MTPQEYKDKLQKFLSDNAARFENMDDWHARRFSGVGGSEIAAVMGKNPYKTAHELWLEKTGKVPPFAGNAATLKGNILEDAVAKWYERETRAEVYTDDTHYQAEDAPWLCGNIDRRIVNGGILECKTAARNPSDDSTEDGFKWGMGNSYGDHCELGKRDEQIPLNYYLQVQQYMALTHAEWCDLAVLFLNGDFKPFRVYRIERNEEVIAKIKTAAHDFMQMVLDDIEPPMTDAELADQYQRADTLEESIELDALLIEEYRAIKSEQKKLDEREKELADKIKVQMGEREIGTVGGKSAVTWKARTSTKLDSKRLKEEKPEIFEEYQTQTSARFFSLARGKK